MVLAMHLYPPNNLDTLRNTFMILHSHAEQVMTVCQVHYRTSLSIIRGFLPPKLASEVPSVLYLALELFGAKKRYPRKPMTLPFFIE